MRRFYGLLFCLAVAVAGIPSAAAQLHIHLLGPDAVTKQADAQRFSQLLALDDSKTVGGFLLGRVTTLVAPDLAGTNSSEVVVRLSAILQRALAHEFVVEITDPKAGDWRAAFRLPGREQQLINGALRGFVQQHQVKIQSPIDTHGSWLLTAPNHRRTVHVTTHGDWLMLDATGDEQPSAWRQTTMRTGSPVPELEGLGRLRCGSEFLPLLVPGLSLPHPFGVSLELRFERDRLRTEGTIDFAHEVPLSLVPFDVPTNSLRDPMISFTAIRGFRNWLATWPELPQWRIPELPDQAFFWAQQDLPMHSLAAFPLPNAAKYFQKQSARVQELLNPELAKRGIGQFAFDEKSGGQVLKGLMLLAPFMAPAPEPSGNWALLGSVIGNRPMGTNTNPPPAELLEQIRRRPNLIYYDWEVTQPRLEQLTMLLSFVRVVAMKFMTSGGDPFPRWMMSIRPFLGNTVTEINRESARRWSFTRTSDIGFTALELNLLAQRFAPAAQFPSLPAQPAK